jgi:hypothetical protein
MTEADLLFAVRVLEAPERGSLEYDQDHPVAVERARVAERYRDLKQTLGSAEGSRLARAEWLGKFLAAREEKPAAGPADDDPAKWFVCVTCGRTGSEGDGRFCAGCLPCVGA